MVHKGYKLRRRVDFKGTPATITADDRSFIIQDIDGSDFIQIQFSDITALKFDEFVEITTTDDRHLFAFGNWRAKSLLRITLGILIIMAWIYIEMRYDTGRRGGMLTPLALFAALKIRAFGQNPESTEWLLNTATKHNLPFVTEAQSLAESNEKTNKVIYRGVMGVAFPLAAIASSYAYMTAGDHVPADQVSAFRIAAVATSVIGLLALHFILRMARRITRAWSNNLVNEEQRAMAELMTPAKLLERPSGS